MFDERRGRLLDSVDVDNPKAAAVFASARQRKIILTLVDRERSLSELANLTETPLNLLHHHIGKFVRLGLVSIAREQSRAGAPVKFYRAVARTFFVPARLMATSPGAELTRRFREQLDHSRLGAILGVAYSHDGVHPKMHVVTDPNSRETSVDLWLNLHLSPGDARALSTDLRALLQTYEARSKPGYKRYILHTALAVSP